MTRTKQFTFNIAGITKVDPYDLAYLYVNQDKEIHLILEREATNSHDHNAIQVCYLLPETDNQTRVKIGYIPKEIAACWAPFLDGGSICLDVVYYEFHGGYYTPVGKLLNLGIKLCIDMYE